MTERTYRALVADDDSAMRTSLEQTLPGYGIRVDLAVDGVMALNQLRRTRYDLLITDLRMPRMHGHRLIAEVMQQPSPPVIVVVTAVAAANLTDDLLRRGVTDIVIKPFEADVFAVKMRHWIDRRQRATGEDSDDVVREIEEAATSLEKKLTLVRASFEKTISSLRAQREALEAGYVGSLRVFANMISEIAPLKGSHITRVETMAAELGKALSVSDDELMDIQMGALLHEIGQFGMPSELRSKPPQSMDADERAGYEKYPVVGATLLAEIPNAENVVVLVECHAENYDGSGFPRGLSGKDIPYGARIIRIADGYDVFRSQVQDGDKDEQAMKHLREKRNTLYDPELVDAVSRYRSERSIAQSEPSRVVSAKRLQPGMRLARNVYDREGRYLARQGVELTENLVDRLISLLGDTSVEVYPIASR